MARTAAQIEQQIEQLWQRWHRNPNARNADALLSRIDYEQGELVLQREYEAQGDKGEVQHNLYSPVCSPLHCPHK